MRKSPHTLPWLAADDAFPPVDAAWGEHDPAPGLLAAGRTLGIASLLQAYRRGIFPWFSVGQPILWWSPDPRMVLRTRDFRLHRSLRRSITHFRAAVGHDIRFDTAFAQVITACASTPRAGQSGTWIVPDMVQAYIALHRAGHAHSVETWINGELVGGLYCVNIGAMVFGESMFAHRTDASKLALAALVAFCRAHGMPMIDCQQNTRHLASLGAAEMPRAKFAEQVGENVAAASPPWEFQPLYWNQIFTDRPQNDIKT